MKAYQDCPRFVKCAVNKCPLDPAYKTMSSVPGDAERKCTLPRKKRQEVGAKYDNLAYGGLTGHEYTALRESNNLPLNVANAVCNALNSERPIESEVCVT